MNKMITLPLLRNTIVFAWLAGCVAVGPACAQTDQEWEREQQQQRITKLVGWVSNAQPALGVDAAPGGMRPMGFSTLRSFRTDHEGVNPAAAQCASINSQNS